jgi:predicted RNase H-like HicB family nuclease
MKNYGFNIFWSNEDEGFIATSPDFPGLSAFGETVEEALSEAQVALKLFIETYEEQGIQLPKPKSIQEYSGQFRLRISKELHRKAAEIAFEEGISLNQFVSNAIATQVGVFSYQKKALKELRLCMSNFEASFQSYYSKQNDHFFNALLYRWRRPTFHPAEPLIVATQFTADNDPFKAAELSFVFAGGK